MNPEARELLRGIIVGLALAGTAAAPLLLLIVGEAIP